MSWELFDGGLKAAVGLRVPGVLLSRFWGSESRDESRNLIKNLGSLFGFLIWILLLWGYTVGPGFLNQVPTLWMIWDSGSVGSRIWSLLQGFVRCQRLLGD